MDQTTVSVITKIIEQCREHEYLVALATDAPFLVEQINGGHLNHVGRVRSASGSRSCIVKVYMDYVKFLGPSMPIEVERCQREYMAGRYFLSLVPGCCPLPYWFDDEHKIGFLEDFPEHDGWGEVLLTFCDLEAGARLADILVALHSASHRGHLHASEFDRLRKTFRPFPNQVNFVCQAQFIKPLLANHRNYKPFCSEAVRAKVDEVITQDVVISASKQVTEWMSVEKGDCCIHGDLHLENVLYNKAQRNIKLIDTDCVRIGPPAYDLGLLVSNYLLLYHYHQYLRHVGVGPSGADHAQLTADMRNLITITMTRYMRGMSKALQEKFEKSFFWRQTTLFMAVEVIGWISGPASFDYIDAHPEVMLTCLDSALTILQREPRDVAELSDLLLLDN